MSAVGEQVIAERVSRDADDVVVARIEVTEDAAGVHRGYFIPTIDGIGGARELLAEGVLEPVLQKTNARIAAVGHVCHPANHQVVGPIDPIETIDFSLREPPLPDYIDAAAQSMPIDDINVI